jgi:hypothetical protein
MRCTIHALLVVLLGFATLTLWAYGSPLTNLTACADALLGLALMARTGAL